MTNQIVHRQESSEETALRQKAAIVDLASSLKEIIDNPKLLASLAVEAKNSLASIDSMTKERETAEIAIKQAAAEKAKLDAAVVEFNQMKSLHETQHSARHAELAAAEASLKAAQEQFAKDTESSRNEVSNEWLKIEAANKAIKEAAYKAQEGKKAQDYLHETRSGALDTLHKKRMAEVDAREKALAEREKRIEELKKAL
jgi:hypothetical protein